MIKLLAVKIEDGYFNAVFIKELPRMNDEIFPKRERYEIAGKLIEGDIPVIIIEINRNLKKEFIKKEILSYLGY